MIYRFDRCELDVERHAFTVDGREVPLEPQVFSLLRLLAERPGIVLSRDTLVDEIWGGRIVSEATISSRINAARRAVGDDGKAQRIIRTVPRCGIKLVCPVTSISSGLQPEPAPPGPERQHVHMTRSKDGTLLAYATTGSGPPLLRGSHWLTHLERDWHSPVWRPLLDALGRDFAVTRWDQRGTGLSARDVDRFDLEAMIDDLEAVADAAGLARFPIFAVSQAVPAAIGFAARRPERVSRLVLYGGYAVGRALRADRTSRAEAEAFQTLVRSGWGRPDSAFIRAFSTMFMPDATPAQLDDFVALQLASASGETAARLREATLRYDVRDRLAAIRAPCLVVHVRGDAVQPPSQAQELAAGIPGAELLMLEGRNHAPLPQDPAWQALIDANRRFLLG